mmetsp:Transcript_13090/g.23917  ORF Transcript_13090/g.23917 Transcript_13090/m.23917 type:complete len:235 (-) Transcript_13090:126-830(-)
MDRPGHEQQRAAGLHGRPDLPRHVLGGEDGGEERRLYPVEHPRGDVTGAHGGDLHVVIAGLFQFYPKGLAPVQRRGFGGAVHSHVGVGVESGCRGDIDDPARALRLQHGRQEFVRDVHGAQGIDLHGELCVPHVVMLPEALALYNPGVVEKHVYLASLQGGRRGLGHVLGIRHIHDLDLNIATHVLQLLRSLLQSHLIDVPQDHTARLLSHSLLRIDLAHTHCSPSHKHRLALH